MLRLLALLLLAMLAAPAVEVAGGGAQGSIRGVIYHDLDRDGVRDAGEPGLLGRGVVLWLGDEEVAATSTAPDGLYRFDGLADGSYTVEAQVSTPGGSCFDAVFSFNPYAQPLCINYEVPWTATPSGMVSVTLDAAVETVQDFAAHESDVMILAGIALAEDDRAPAGTLVEAVFNGVECGSMTVDEEESGTSNYLLYVLGSGQSEGCPSRDDMVRFRIGGVDAPEVRLYRAWAETPGDRLQMQPLTAIRQHAWLWAERPVPEPPPVATVVEALVGNTVCGNVEVEYIAGEVGFSRFLVASDDLIEGCGTEGAPMTFRTQQLGGALPLPWSAHLREVTLRFYGDVNCSYGASSLDALLLLQLVSGRTSGLPCREGSDVNENGATDAIDAALVLQLSAGLIDRLPVG
jgi:hypothetical protein